jgi:O-antigen ligase
LMGAAVFCCLTGSLLLGAVLGEGFGTPAVLLLAMVVAAALIVFAINNFRTAVLLVPLVVLTVQNGLATGTRSLVPVSMLFILMLTGIWVISQLARGWQLAPSPLNMPMLAFAVVSCISLVWGIVWRDPDVITPKSFPIVQLASLATVILSLSAALLVGNFFTNRRHLVWLLGVFLVVGAFNLADRILELPLNIFIEKGLWALWIVAPAYGLLIAQPRIPWYWRVVLVVLLALTLYRIVVVNDGWLSGWIPSVVVLFVITFLHSRKAFLVALVLGAIVAIASYDFLVYVATINIQDGSLERLDLWEQNLEIVRQHWLFGTGPAGYTIYYRTFYEDTRSTHNNYMDILAQFGVVGSAVWLWLCLASLREGWVLIKRAAPGLLRTVAIISTGGWAAALFSMVLGDWVLPYAYNQTIYGFRYTVLSWIFLGTLISIRQILHAQDTATTDRAIP